MEIKIERLRQTVEHGDQSAMGAWFPKDVGKEKRGVKELEADN